MKPPPFLIAAALVFWGWQTGLLLPSLLMALVLELPRYTSRRWEFSDRDISRIWVFCSVLFLTAIVYAFTANDGPGSFSGLLGDLSVNAQRRASDSSSQTAVSIVRWLPMVVFLLVAAQSFNTRPTIPFSSISFLYRRRLARAGNRRAAPMMLHTGHVHWTYFGVCLCASTTTIEATRVATFFAGFGVLLAWALWPHRSQRFGFVIWAAVLALVLTGGYMGQRGLVVLQRVLNASPPEWFARFNEGQFDPEQTQSSMGHVGRIKTSGRIVIRLRTEEGKPPPSLLRAASYRDYRWRSWRVGEAAGDFQYLPSVDNGTRWLLQRDVSGSNVVTIACAVPGQKGLIPLPDECAVVERVPSFAVLYRNGNGAVLVEGAGFVRFTAHYGSGQTADAAPEASDRRVPRSEQTAIRQIASELGVAGAERSDILNAVGQFFGTKFEYSLWQEAPAPGTNRTDLARFLLETRRGHCEYFATATVLLLRELGLNARYAVGYAVHEGSRGRYVVRQRDAHAWCLVWNEDTATWDPFDTTPGSWIDEERQRASLFEWLSDGWSWIKFQIGNLRWGESNFRQYILWGLIPVLGLLLYQIIFRRRNVRRAGSGSGDDARYDWPGLDSEFYLLETRLRELGYVRGSDETMARWLDRLRQSPALLGFERVLEELLSAHYRLRFDPRGLPDKRRRQLQEQVRQCLSDMRGLTRETEQVG